MTQCTCPEFSSFGHEPGCPMLAELAAQREERTPETKAFMTLIDDSEIDLGMVEAKLGDMERQRDEARLELEGIQAGAGHLNQTIAEMLELNRLLRKDRELTLLLAIQPKKIREMLVKHGLVDFRAVEDPEGFNNYLTLDAVNAFALELHHALFTKSSPAAAHENRFTHDSRQ